jgi:hypothetical protein
LPQEGLVVLRKQISLFFLSAFLSLHVSAAPCLTPGYTIGFFNGVWNTRLGATDSLTKLYALYPATLNGLPVTKQLFYNQSGCVTPGATCLQDVAETFIQRANAIDASGVLAKDFVVFWEAVTGTPTYSNSLAGVIPSIGNLIGSLFTTVTNRILALTALLISTPPTALTMTTNNADLDRLAANGQYFTLIAHSQGNLFLNQAYDHILPTVGASGVQAVHIAPASPTLRGDYVLSSSDTIIGALSLTGGVSPVNFTLPKNPLDASGHGLLNTYLHSTLPSVFNSMVKTPVQVVTDLIAFAMNRLGVPVAPSCIAAICPDTFTQTQLAQVQPGMTVAQVNNVFGCAGRNGGMSNWFSWYNDQSLVSLTLNTASVFFTNGVYLPGAGKSISGNVIP